MVSFDWYRSFIAIYRAGTVTAAADARFLTQPAVSQHLAALESAVGQPLFSRAPRRMVPTERGKELYAEIAGAVDTLDRTGQALLAAVNSERPLLRLGAPAEYFTEVALERLADAPFRCWVRFGQARSLLDDLERGELELVIATQRLPAAGVEYVKLAEEHFVLVGSLGHAAPPVSDPPATHDASERVEAWLAAQRWISYAPELPIIRRFWQHAFGRRPDLQPALVIPDLRTIAKAVELGHGISVLPDYLCQAAVAAGRLRVLWQPPTPVANELWLAHRRVERTNANVRHALDLLAPASLSPERSPLGGSGSMRQHRDR